MLRTNLLTKTSSRESTVRNVAWWAVILVTTCHFLALGWSWFFARQSFNAIERLEVKKAALLAGATDSRPKADPKALAGCLAARNTWLHFRKRGPAPLFHRISQTKPQDSTIDRFDAGQSGGTVEFLSPSIDEINRWVFAAFGGTNGRLTVKDQQGQGVRAIYAWVE